MLRKTKRELADIGEAIGEQLGYDLLLGELGEYLRDFGIDNFFIIHVKFAIAEVIELDGASKVYAFALN